ncbi:MAG: hypothetical protein HY782_13700 [Chloroflexi bacterium]|nr:hypothetical protein [Chloroflexota bacterium]
MSSSPWEDLKTVLKHAEEAQAAGDRARAYAFYARATELDPNHLGAWLGRAATTSDLDDAITSWASARALAPDHAEAREQLDRHVTQKIQESTIEQVESLISLSRWLADVGQKSSAYVLVKRATELDDTNEQGWIWRAGLTDNPKEMISALNQVLALKPDNQQAQAGLEWALAFESGAPPSSPDAAEEASRLVEQGQAALQKGDKTQAHELFKHATELDAQNEQAWLWRGGTTADIDDALTCMEQALAINPENEPAREARAWLRVKKLRESAKAQAEVLPPTTRAPTVGMPTVSSADWRRNRGTILAIFIIVLLIVFLVFVLRMQG